VAFVRILVDGYSLLHSWTDLAPGKPRYSAAARDELVHVLTQYGDAIKSPITVIFDGAGAPVGTPEARSRPEMEILYSRRGQTADELIERAAHRLQAYGEVLVVTNDLAERDTVASFGAMASSCENFIQSVSSALHEMNGNLKRHNKKELGRFKQARKT
jgi:predicted RNA-binding protein with PIN domain